MHLRYLDRSALPRSAADRMQLFRRLFAHLLLQSDGDAERALDWLERIGERHGLFDDDLTPEQVRKQLVRDRLITTTTEGVELTSKGERFVRTSSLDEVFRGLKLDPGGGDHRTPRTGVGGEPTSETRPWRFGDDLDRVDFQRSFVNAFRRTGDTAPVLSEDDLEVRDSEQHVSVATCLLLDISHSMILYGEDRITPAKRTAMALAELITTRYPKDALHIILFGDVAQEISLKELTYAGVGPYHTNTHMALQLARQILSRKKHANRQIFMITDGKPSALLEGDELYLNPMGLDPKIKTATLNQAAECRRAKIPITTFMIARDQLLVQFVEELTRINQGRAFFSSLDRLEQTVFVDFVANRRKKVR